MKKRLAILVLLIVAGTAGGWYWLNRDVSVDTGILVLHGNVDIRQISLAFEESGRITALTAEEGDTVTAGQRLGTLDTRTLALQADQAEARVEQQRQALLELENGSRQEEVDQALARLAEAEADSRLAEIELSRARRLKETRSAAISQQGVDQAQSAADAAAARVEERQAALRLTVTGPRAEDIAGARAALAAAEADLALLRHRIARGRLLAPTDAVVRARLLEPGDMASPQVPAFTLALTRPKWIRVYVGETDLGKVRPGMAAEVTTDSHPDTPVPGTVGYIASVAEFTPKTVQTEELRTSLVYEVRVRVEDEAGALRLGQPATVRLSLDPAR